MESAREAFGEFLVKYPYCYGYWKKYADMEKKHKHLDRAEEVIIYFQSSEGLKEHFWKDYQ